MSLYCSCFVGHRNKACFENHPVVPIGVVRAVKTLNFLLLGPQDEKLKEAMKNLLRGQG